MSRIRLTMGLFAILVLLTACGASGSVSGGRADLSPSVPITAGTPVPSSVAGPLLAAGQQSGDLRVWLSSKPVQPVQGMADLDALLAGSDGHPLTGARVTFDSDMTNMSHGLYLVPAEATTDGHYVGRVHFSMPGPWRIITIIERPGLPTVRLRFEFRVNG
jgi:YtkA-like